MAHSATGSSVLARIVKSSVGLVQTARTRPCASPSVSQSVTSLGPAFPRGVSTSGLNRPRHVPLQRGSGGQSSHGIGQRGGGAAGSEVGAVGAVSVEGIPPEEAELSQAPCAATIAAAAAAGPGRPSDMLPSVPRSSLVGSGGAARSALGTLPDVTPRWTTG